MNEQELAELDLAVAKAEGVDPLETTPDGMVMGYDDEVPVFYRPTRDGAVAMWLLEKYRLELRHDGKVWSASGSGCWEDGTTPAIAICRAVVALSQQGALGAEAGRDNDTGETKSGGTTNSGGGEA